MTIMDNALALIVLVHKSKHPKESEGHDYLCSTPEAERRVSFQGS